MINDRDNGVGLSEAGRSRRHQMRDELIGKMRHIHRARKRRRTSLAATLVIALIGGLWFVRIAPQSVPQPHTPTLVEQTAEDESITRQPIRITRIERSAPNLTHQIETDSNILDRYRIREVPSRVTYLTDEQLVRELAAIGEPASVVRLGDTVLLMHPDRNGWQ
jgi:hypothetical protein